MLSAKEWKRLKAVMPQTVFEGVNPLELEGVVKPEVIMIPELENRENARWLALLVDTEGAIGYAEGTQNKAKRPHE
ncbi:MAG: hypothetical protein AOA65_1918 [Candidatus Bathyarchaeota archaeon BA1]|nr:MAG: hypothetical protein AOA65_1918 [Candidatus Bathyarchaeota archaeon BA1]